MEKQHSLENSVLIFKADFTGDATYAGLVWASFISSFDLTMLDILSTEHLACMASEVTSEHISRVFRKKSQDYVHDGCIHKVSLTNIVSMDQYYEEKVRIQNTSFKFDGESEDPLEVDSTGGIYPISFLDLLDNLADTITKCKAGFDLYCVSDDVITSFGVYEAVRHWNRAAFESTDEREQRGEISSAVPLRRVVNTMGRIKALGGVGAQRLEGDEFTFAQYLHFCLHVQTELSGAQAPGHTRTASADKLPAITTRRLGGGGSSGAGPVADQRAAMKRARLAAFCSQPAVVGSIRRALDSPAPKHELPTAIYTSDNRSEGATAFSAEILGRHRVGPYARYSICERPFCPPVLVMVDPANDAGSCKDDGARGALWVALRGDAPGHSPSVQVQVSGRRSRAATAMKDLLRTGCPPVLAVAGGVADFVSLQQASPSAFVSLQQASPSAVSPVGQAQQGPGSAVPKLPSIHKALSSSLSRQPGAGGTAAGGGASSVEYHQRATLIHHTSRFYHSLVLFVNSDFGQGGGEGGRGPATGAHPYLHELFGRYDASSMYCASTGPEEGVGTDRGYIFRSDLPNLMRELSVDANVAYARALLLPVLLLRQMPSPAGKAPWRAPSPAASRAAPHADTIHQPPYHWWLALYVSQAFLGTPYHVLSCSSSALFPIAHSAAALLLLLCVFL